jgi:hypothetical protein
MSEQDTTDRTPLDLDAAQRLCDDMAKAETTSAVRWYGLHADARLTDAARALDMLPRAVTEVRYHRADNEWLRLSEAQWEDFLGRVEAELRRIAERFPAEGYPDGDVEWSIRQHGPAAALEQIAYLIGKQQDELRAAEKDAIPLLQERDQLRGLLRRHHEYISGLTGGDCRLCEQTP